MLRYLALCCALLFAAPAFAGDDIRVVNEGGIRDRWMLKEGVPLVAPQYPAQFAKRHDEVCVSIGYLVKPDGTLSDFTMLKAWSSASGTSEPEGGYWSAFAEAAGDALGQWRFQPRPEVTSPQPVFTVGTFVFGTKGASPQVRDHCRIPSLVAHLRDLSEASAHRHPPQILARLDLRNDESEAVHQRQAVEMYRP
jgi:hypothetical protein